MLEVIQSMLKEIGIGSKIEIVEFHFASQGGYDLFGYNNSTASWDGAIPPFCRSRVISAGSPGDKLNSRKLMMEMPASNNGKVSRRRIR